MSIVHRRSVALISVLVSFAGPLGAQSGDPTEAEFLRKATRVVARDAFPVFRDPEFLPAAEAETSGLVHDASVVVGVTGGRIAKAYPIAVLGVHELGNDMLGDVPIAPSW